MVSARHIVNDMSLNSTSIISMCLGVIIVKYYYYKLQSCIFFLFLFSFHVNHLAQRQKSKVMVSNPDLGIYIFNFRFFRMGQSKYLNES